MKTILLSQRKERDDLLAQNYIGRHTNFNTDDLLSSHLIKLITGPRRVGKSTQALLMLRQKNFAYLNFDKQELLDNWNADLVMRLLDEVYPGYDFAGHKGYGTAAHYKAIRELGMCPIHRRSFLKVIH